MSIKHTVGQFMTRHPHTIGVDQSLALAHRMMRQNGLRHLPVLEGGRLVGLLSERDLALVEASRRLDIDKATVDKAMSVEPYCVAADASLIEVAREMASQRHGSAIVLEDGNVVGIFTTVDALMALAHVLAAPVERPRARAAVH
jgi:acetoin utilization protein AcuB